MKKDKIGNLIGILLCVLLLPFVTVSMTLTIKSYAAPGKVATFLGYGPLIIETGSMRPAFKENDVVLMRQCDAGALENGEIIAYYDANGTIVTHRIIGYDTDGSGARLYITQGDANNIQDRDPVPAAQVAGRVVKVIPDGGKAMNFIGKPLVTVAVILLPIGLWFCCSRLAKTLARRKEKKEVTAQTDEAQPLE